MDSKTVNKIEKYLQGKLSKNDLHDFESRMKSDPDFEREVKLRLEINSALMEKDIMSLRSKLTGIHHQQHNKRNSTARIVSLFSEKGYATAGIAAAIVLTLVVGTLLIFGLQDKNPQNLFASYYQPDDAVMIVRSGSNPEDIDLKEALLAYHEKNYDNAIELLDKQENNILAKYYLGLSYLETDKISKAISTFKAIIDHNNNLFVEQAEWYLALCYVKNDQEEEAKIWFEKIANSESIFNDKAKRVLKNM